MFRFTLTTPPAPTVVLRSEACADWLRPSGPPPELRISARALWWLAAFSWSTKHNNHSLRGEKWNEATNKTINDDDDDDDDKTITSNDTTNGVPFWRQPMHVTVSSQFWPCTPVPSCSVSSCQTCLCPCPYPSSFAFSSPILFPPLRCSSPHQSWLLPQPTTSPSSIHFSQAQRLSPCPCPSHFQKHFHCLFVSARQPLRFCCARTNDACLRTEPMGRLLINDAPRDLNDSSQHENENEIAREEKRIRSRRKEHWIVKLHTYRDSPERYAHSPVCVAQLCNREGQVIEVDVRTGRQPWDECASVSSAGCCLRGGRLTRAMSRHYFWHGN